jgi:hypothetical protein
MGHKHVLVAVACALSAVWVFHFLIRDHFDHKMQISQASAVSSEISVPVPVRTAFLKVFQTNATKGNFTGVNQKRSSERNIINPVKEIKRNSTVLSDSTYRLFGAIRKVERVGVHDILDGIQSNKNEPNTARWRNNFYIRDDGILPYARCGSDKQIEGTFPLFSRFRIGSDVFDLMILAASVWGESFFDGMPSSLISIELLAYFVKNKHPCERCSGNHCKLPKNSSRLNVTCMYPFGQNEHLPGTLEIIQNRLESHSMAAVIQCPIPTSICATCLPENWTMAVSVGEDQDIASVQICYQHVSKQVPVVLCSQPLYGFDPSKGFWKGNPPFHNHTLFDAFLIYHTRVMGMHVRINDLHRQFLPRLLEIGPLNDSYSYRSGWQLLNLVDRKGVWDYEVLAEATCQWEFRIRARWFMILHSVDTYILPMNSPNLPAALERVSPRVSSIIVPMVHGCSTEVPRRGDNILAQYGRIGKPFPFENRRHTPIGNPRHIHYSHVHWNSGFRVESFVEVGLRDAVNVLGLQSLHLMSLTRTQYDLGEACARPAIMEPLAAQLRAELADALMLQ